MEQDLDIGGGFLERDCDAAVQACDGLLAGDELAAGVQRGYVAAVDHEGHAIADRLGQAGYDAVSLNAPAWYGSRYRMSIANLDTERNSRDLYSGLIRLHILHHAAKEPVFGLGMAEELARHGYRISLGTLYPLLHGLEKKAYLKSETRRNGRSLRKVYRATPLGRRALAAATSKVRELFGELVEGK